MAEPHDPHVGKLINDRFRVLEPIARGDTSRVYRAEQMPLGRVVALKILDPSYCGEDDRRFTQRFLLEASVASRLRHPNTVAVFDYGRTEDGTYFIAMEYVAGESLRAVLRRAHTLRAETAAAIAIQIARSAREAHSLNVVHRDLRPANVLLTQHGDDEYVVKVLGFGLAKPLDQSGPELTQTGVFLGSPGYMSPEHIRGERLDGRSDVYSLGVLMYELIVGEVPFERPTAVKVLMAHMHDPPPPIRAADVPVAFADLIHACLHKRPEDRPASMGEVIARLKSIALELGMRPAVLSSSASLPPAPQVDAALPRGSLRHARATAGAPSRGSMPTSRAGARRRRRWQLGLIAVTTVVATALGLREREGAPGDGAGAADTEPTAPSTANGRPGSEAPSLVRVRITSEPPGAEVEVGGRHYGVTPLWVELQGDQARTGAELTVVLQLAGHEPARVTRRIAARRIEIHAALAERSPDPAAPPAHTP